MSEWAQEFGDIIESVIKEQPSHLETVNMGIRLMARTQQRFASVSGLSGLSPDEAASAIMDGFEVPHS